ncbi:MAG: hypothetical protein ACLFT4_10210 [Bacteroidales bacterium]
MQKRSFNESTLPDFHPLTHFSIFKYIGLLIFYPLSHFVPPYHYLYLPKQPVNSVHLSMFWTDEKRTRYAEPLALKESINRWYVVAMDAGKKAIRKRSSKKPIRKSASV